MPEAIKNLKEAAQRVVLAGARKESVIIYGDADLDGVAAAIIMQETVKNLGGNVVATYFPDREFEGYGITRTALKKLQPFAPALLIAVDLGIGNFEEIKIAKSLGFETMIIDHHEILDGLPEADIIVDPKQPGDNSRFKFFSAAGLVLRVAESAMGSALGPVLHSNFLELAALATMADMMPREDQNREIIDEGVANIAGSFRPGIRAFFDSKIIFDGDSDNLNRKLNRIISILNVRDMRDGIPAAFKLLTTQTLDVACQLIGEFIKINELRRERIREVIEEIEERILGNNEPIIFEGSANWELNLVGTIASIINQKYQKPTFVYKTLETREPGHGPFDRGGRQRGADEKMQEPADHFRRPPQGLRLSPGKPKRQSLQTVPA